MNSLPGNLGGTKAITVRPSTAKFLLGWLMVVTLTACSSATVYETLPTESPQQSLEPIVYEVIDPKGDVIFDNSKGDGQSVERAEKEIDLLGTTVSASSEWLIVSFKTVRASMYVAPTAFTTDAIVDRVFYYYVYIETDGDGSFDYRLAATNNYDSAEWEGELWETGENFNILGGNEFPGFVQQSENTIDLYLMAPLRNLDGEVWAFCPGTEFAYTKTLNDVPAGAEYSDFIWNGSSKDLVEGTSDSQTCIAGHNASITVSKRDIVGN